MAKTTKKGLHTLNHNLVYWGDGGLGQLLLQEKEAALIIISSNI